MGLTSEQITFSNFSLLLKISIWLWKTWHISHSGNHLSQHRDIDDEIQHQCPRTAFGHLRQRMFNVQDIKASTTVWWAEMIHICFRALDLKAVRSWRPSNALIGKNDLVSLRTLWEVTKLQGTWQRYLYHWSLQVRCWKTCYSSTRSW